MEIKDYIKSRRNELGLSQLDVAKFVGVSEATVSRWESGDIANMGASRIKALAEVLRTSPLQILGEDYYENTPAHGEGEGDVSVQLDTLVNKLKNEETLMFNGYKMSKEAAAALAASLEAVDNMTAQMVEERKKKEE